MLMKKLFSPTPTTRVLTRPTSLEIVSETVVNLVKWEIFDMLIAPLENKVFGAVAKDVELRSISDTDFSKLNEA